MTSWGRGGSATVPNRRAISDVDCAPEDGHDGSRLDGGDVRVETTQAIGLDAGCDLRGAGVPGVDPMSGGPERQAAPEWRASARKAVGFARARALFGLHGVSVGRLPQVHGRLALRCRGELLVGDRLVIDGWPLATKISVGPEGRLVVGAQAFLNYGVDINAQTSIVIGDNVRIGPLVSIVDDAMHEVTPGHRRRARISIGDNVWIGRGVAIGPGVTIGDHAVIGTNSVVTRDVAAATVVAGSPAVLVRDIDVPTNWQRR